jgi:hypothetical protein
MQEEHIPQSRHPDAATSKGNDIPTYTGSQSPQEDFVSSINKT